MTTSTRQAWEGHTGEVVDRGSGFDVIACAPCGFKHVVPLPTTSELVEVYTHDFYLQDKPLYLERHKEDLEWWNSVYAERYSTFEALLPSGRRRVLDVGSGPGYFLLHGKQRGWSTMGIEPSRQAVSHSRELGLEVVEALLDSESARGLGRFDVVHLRNVLEHVPDPAAFVRLVASLIDPGGLVSITVPNDYSPFQEALRKVCGFRPWWVAPPHHLNFFDAASLRGLLEATGFEILEQEATFPIDLFLLMGDNYVGDDAVGRACHARRKRFECNLVAAGLGPLKRELYKRMSELGIGREVVLTARRGGTS